MLCVVIVEEDLLDQSDDALDLDDAEDVLEDDVEVDAASDT